MTALDRARAWAALAGRLGRLGAVEASVIAWSIALDARREAA